MTTIHAVFENGVFRPMGPVDLPENCTMQFEPRVVGAPDDPGHRARVRSLLSERFESGRHDLAERHNEYQP